MIYATEGALAEYGDKVDPVRQADVRAKLEACRLAILGDDVNSARLAVAELEAAAQTLFESLA